VEISGVALAVDRKSQEREGEQEHGEVEKWAHGSSGGIFMLPVSRGGIGVTKGIRSGGRQFAQGRGRVRGDLSPRW
jgi:hypothetical protein